MRNMKPKENAIFLRNARRFAIWGNRKARSYQDRAVELQLNLIYNKTCSSLSNLLLCVKFVFNLLKFELDSATDLLENRHK